MSLKRCPLCDSALEKGSFCPHCGLRIPQPSLFATVSVVGFWILLVTGGLGGTCSLVAGTQLLTDKNGYAPFVLIPFILFAFWSGVAWFAWRRIHGERD
jgi:hypothetical protein